MKIAFSTLGCPDWDLKTIIAKAVEYGYGAIEFRGILRKFDLTKVPELTEEVAKTRRLLTANALSVACVSASSRFSSPDPEVRRQNILSAKDHMDIARALHAPCIRVFGGNIPEGVSRQECEDFIAEALEELGQYGKQIGVKVALETHDSFSTGEHVAAVMRKVKNDMVGVLWDIHHPFKNGEPPAKTMDLIGDRVIHIHVKDGDFTTYTLLGEGKVPVKEVFSLLNAGGYKGYLSLEWEKAWKPELADPEIAFPQYAAVMRQYLDEI